MSRLWRLLSKLFRAGSEFQRSTAVVSFNHDGLEIARKKTERGWLPFGHLAIFLYLVLLLRLVTIADIGAASYESRMEKLEDGSFLERVTARVMFMDPWSRSLASDIRSNLRDLGVF